MPSQAMQDLIDAFRDRQEASASQAPPTLEERRAAFAPGGRLHPVPDDVLVKDVTAGGVPAGLPERQREAIVLRYYAGLSEGEIAAAMGISRGAVNSHTARGLSALRAALEQASPQPARPRDRGDAGPRHD